MRRWSWIALVLPLVAGCSCDEGLSNAAGQVTATPAALDFGGVHVGDQGMREVSFRNDGRTAVSLRAAEMPAAFRAEPEVLQIGPGSSASWRFFFAPQAVGPAGGDARLVATGASDEAIVLPMTGEGLSRELRVADLDFGMVPVGEERTLPLEVTSESNGPLTVQLSLVGADADFFTLFSSSFELPARATRSVQMGFRPPTRGLRSVTLELRTCAACLPHQVTLRGTGAVTAIDAVPRHLDFGFVSLGGTRMIELELANTGDYPILVGSAALDAPGTDFSAALDVFPLELAGREKVRIPVTFSPPLEAERELQQGTIRFFDGEDVLLAEVPMTGTPGGPAIGVTPEQLDFGFQPVGLAISRVVTVRNFGDPGSVLVYGAHVEGAQQENFQVHVLDDLPADAGTDLVNIEVVFQAVQAGDIYGDLVISTGDDERPLIRVPMGGTARMTQPCTLTVVPSRLRFGLVPSRGEYVRDVTVRNDGEDDCLIWDVRFEEGSSPYFATAGTPSETTVIPVGGSLPLSVRFTPNGHEEVLQEAVLSFGHSTPATPRRRIDVSGMGSRHRIDATPNPLVLDARAIGFPNLGFVTVANRGELNVTVIGANRSAETSPEFSVDPSAGVPGTLVTDATGVFQVRYVANEQGIDEGQIEIWIAEATEPYLVDMRAAGTDDTCEEECAAPVAYCPGPQVTNVNNVIQLVGGGADATNDPLTCTWRVVGRPIGSSAAPQTPAQCITGFVPDLVGDYTLELTVRDPMGNEGKCTTDVHANPYGGIWVEMYWSPAGDIDLHLLHPNAGSPAVRSSWTDMQWACHYANCKLSSGTPLEWDSPTLNDNPSLDVDDITGTGPENIRIHQPSTSHHYSVGFKNFSNGNFPVAVTVNVYCGGVQVYGQTYQSTVDDEIFHVGDVTYSSNGCTFVPSTTVIQ